MLHGAALLAFQEVQEGGQVVRSEGHVHHAVHHVRHDGAGINRIQFVLCRAGAPFRHGGDQAGHIHRLPGDGEGISAQGILLHPVDIVLYAVGEGEDEGDADDADAPGKGGQQGPPLLGQQVRPAQVQGGEEAHGRLLRFAPLRQQAVGVVILVGAIIGIRVPDDQAVQQAHDSRGIAVRQVRIVGDHNDQPGTADLLQDLHDLHAGLRVQGAGGFVRQHDVRVVHQGAGDGHPLHLAAGHLGGLFHELVPQPYLLQGSDGPLPPLRLSHAGEGQGQLHVSQHRLVGDELIGLENKTDGMVAVGVPVPVVEVFGGTAVDGEVAGGVAVQPADNVQQCGLAAAALAQYGHEFASPEAEAHALQGVDLRIPQPIVFYDISECEHLAFPFPQGQ